MLLNQIIVALFAVSVVLVMVILGWLFARCAFLATRGGHYKIAVLSLAGIVALAAVFIAVGAVWFGYGVAHSKKDVWTDLRVVLITGVPFHGIAYLLWRLARRLLAQLTKSGVATLSTSTGHPVQ